MLAQAISSSLLAAGRDVEFGDVAATPTTGILVRELGAAGGIQISASHNPPPWNGIKLFGADGRVIPAAAGEQVRDAYLAGNTICQSHDRIGEYRVLSDTISAHLERVLATVDVDAIRARRFRVVLDSNHGAGAVLGRPLLAALGCELTCLGETPNGQFAHPPEPTAANLQSTVAAALELKADAVFCQDPDADRLALIDERGKYVGEEYTLALTLEHALRQNPGPVAINCSSSRMSADLCQRFGCELHLTAVGEANVTDTMLARGAVYGGEGNGGPIDPRVGYVRDSFVGMAQILDAMAHSGQPLSQLAAALPRYEICKTTIAVARDAVAGMYDALENRFSEATASRQDGLRLDWPDRWILVRPSNTEPIVRAIAEARTQEEAQALCDAAAELVP